MSGINLLDMLAIAVLLISFVTALLKGLAAELISLASVVVGVFAAAFYYPQSGAVLSRLGVSAPWSDFFGFVSLFIGAVVGGSLLIRFIDKALKTLRLKWIDRLLGGAFGLLRGWLINVVVFLALAAFPVGENLLAASRSSRIFLASASLLTRIVPKELREKFDNGYRNAYQLWIEQQSGDHGTPP